MKKIDSIDEGIGLPDWKLSLCLLLAWIIICAILMKGVKTFHLIVNGPQLISFFLFHISFDRLHRQAKLLTSLLSSPTLS